MIFLFIVSILLNIILIYYLSRESRRYGSLSLKYQKSLKEHDTVLSFLKKIGTFRSGSITVEGLLNDVVKFSLDILDAASGAVFLLSEDKSFMKIVTLEGIFPPLKRPSDDMMKKIVSKASYLERYLLSQRFSLRDGLLRSIIETGKPVLIADPVFDSRVPRYGEPMLRIESMVMVPLKMDDEIIGVLALVNKKDGSSFTLHDMDLLSSLADYASIAIRNLKVYSSILEKEKLDRDLRISRDIQYMLLPRKDIRIEGWEIASWTVSAMEIGGDYYDVIDLGRGRYGVVIGDVSGKSIPGALVMNMTRSILRAKAQELHSASTVLREVNEFVCEDIEPGMFISLAYLIIDTNAGMVNYARAGHEPLIHYSSREQRCILLKPGGMVLGMDAGPFFNNTLAEERFKTDSGDILVLYTDGVTEACNEDGDEFGLTNLVDSIGRSAGLSAEGIVDAIKERVNRFTGNAPQADDITLLVMKRK